MLATLATIPVGTVAKDLLILIVLYALFKRLVVPHPLQDIPGPRAASWLTGNLMQLFDSKGLAFHAHLVDLYGGMVKVYGFFGDKQLYVTDPHAIQAILGKQQDFFEESTVFLEQDQSGDIWAWASGNYRRADGHAALKEKQQLTFELSGDLHKRQRRLAGPMFSNAQLTQVTPAFYGIAEKLASVLQRQVMRQKTVTCDAVLDMSEWSSRVSLEMAGQALIGCSFDPLDSPVSNAYTAAIKELIPTVFSLAFLRECAPLLKKLGPAWLRRKAVEWTPNKAVQKVKDMSDVMHTTAQKILEERREQLRCEGTERTGPKDVISMLLKANARAKPEDRMSDDELTGQMTVLIFGAQDTTSAALSRIFDVLAAHPDVQSKVREEIRQAYLDPGNRDARFVNNLGQETIMALPWLDAVIKETMRLYPPVSFVRRICIKDTIVPYTRLHDGRNCDLTASAPISHVSVPNGTTLFLGITGCNRMESIWGADAKEWKPERWLTSDSETAVNSTLNAPPCNPNVKFPGAFNGTLTFLGGSRACIGARFAMLEMKIILATLLSKMHFAPTGDDIVWNLAQIISPFVSRTVPTLEGGVAKEENKGLPLVATLHDLASPALPPLRDGAGK